MKTIAAILFTMALFLMLLLFSGCNLPEHPGEPTDALSYWVDPELEGAFDGASERIALAAGIQLTEDGETPIIAVPELPSDDENGYLCGLTEITYNAAPFYVIAVEIQILWPQRPGCEATTSVLHELIHSLRRDLITEDRVSGMGHTEDGAFAVDAGNHKLNSASLEAICNAQPCSVFSPEG